MRRLIIFLFIFLSFRQASAFLPQAEKDHFLVGLRQLDTAVKNYRRQDEHGVLFFDARENEKLLRYRELLRFSWTLLPQENKAQFSSLVAFRNEFMRNERDFGIGYEYLSFAEVEGFYRNIDTYYNNFIKPLESKTSLTPEELNDLALFYGIILEIQKKQYRPSPFGSDDGSYNFCGSTALSSPLFKKVLREKPELLSSIDNRIFMKSDREFDYKRNCSGVLLNREGPIELVKKIKREVEQERTARELAQRPVQDKPEKLLAAAGEASAENFRDSTQPPSCPTPSSLSPRANPSLAHTVERVEQLNRELSGSARPTLEDYAARAQREGVRREETHNPPHTPPASSAASTSNSEKGWGEWLWEQAFCHGHNQHACKHYRR